MLTVRCSHTSGLRGKLTIMIEPEVTAVLGRRYLALLLDSSLVAATGLGVAYQQSTAFTVVGRNNDEPLVDPAEFERLEELLDFELFGQSEVFGVNLVRAQEIGDSLRIFGADSYLWGLGAALVAAAVVFFMIPALIQRTLGMLPLGLAIRDIQGGKATVGAHLKRSLVGIFDMVPGVIPGLIGFLVAGLSPRHQRLGDRAAGTTVVDRKLANFHTSDDQASPMPFEHPPADPAEADDSAAPSLVADPSPATSRLEADLVSTSAPGDAALANAELANAEPANAERANAGAGNAEPVDALPPNAREAPDAIDTAVPAQVPPSETPPFIPLDEPSLPVAETPARIEPEQVATVSDPSEPVSPPTPTPSRSFDDAPLPPPPVHRKPVTATSDRTDLSQPLHDTEADRSSTEPFATLRAPSPTASTPAEGPDPALDAATHAPTGVAETASQSWEPPRIEPAPVWQPASYDPAPIEALDPHDGRTLDDVVRSEPSIGELISTDPVAPEDPEGSDRAAAASRYGQQAAGREGGSAKAPVWSDKWRAWMYWDPKKKCWLRHDTSSNTWVAVD